MPFARAVLLIMIVTLGLVQLVLFQEVMLVLVSSRLAVHGKTVPGTLQFVRTLASIMQFV